VPVLRTGGKRDTLLRFRRHVILPDNQPRITTVLRGRNPSIRPFERAGLKPTQWDGLWLDMDGANFLLGIISFLLKLVDTKRLGILNRTTRELGKRQSRSSGSAVNCVGTV
jgi:hypothetical protein